jgi:hypothetical protein
LQAHVILEFPSVFEQINLRVAVSA